MSVLILNGKTSATKPNEDLLVNKYHRFDPSVINGLMPTDVIINGLTRPPALSGCVFDGRLWHPALSGSTFRDLSGNNLCTVTGALWTPQGRLFDAVDDKIAFGDTSTLAWMHGKGNTTAFAWTFLCWFTQLHPGVQFAVLLDTNGTSSSKTGVAIYLNQTTRAVSVLVTRGVAGNVCSIGTTGAFPNNTAFQKLAVTYDQSLASANLKVYINDAAVETANKTANAPNDANADYAPLIGAVNAGAIPFDGKIGDYLIPNRALTAGEIRNWTLATKWRYQ